MEKNLRRRLIAALLAVVIIAPVLRGWMGGKMMSAAEKMDKDHTYKAEYMELPIEEISIINVIKLSNNKVFVDGYNENDEYQYAVFELNPDSSNSKKMLPRMIDTGTEFVKNFTADTKGNLYYLVSEYVSDDLNEEQGGSKRTYAIIKKDKNDKEIFHYRFEDEGFFPSHIVADTEENLILSSYDELVIFNKDGEKVGKIHTKDAVIEKLFMSNNGRLLAILNDTYECDIRVICEFFVNKKKFGAPMKAPGETMYNFVFMGAGYDLFLHDRINVYGYDIKSGEKTQLLNWIESDINGYFVNYVGTLSDGSFFCVISNYVKDKTEIAIMSKVEPKDVADKNVLTLASVWEDYNVNSAVIQFNKKNPKYQIVIKNYSVYNSYEEDDDTAGNNKLNKELLSGNIPNILIVNDTGPFKSCVDKGMFMDLNIFIEKDREFKKEDYLTNVFDALANEEKLYVLVPYFDVLTVIGKTKHVESTPGWTVEDLDKVVEKLPEGARVFDWMDGSDIVHDGYNMCMDQYIDWNSGICTFDDGEFAKLLEISKQLPKYDENDNSVGEPSEFSKPEHVSIEIVGDKSMFRRDKLLLSICNLRNFNDIHKEQAVNFGDDITFIGFPTANKKGSAISPGLQLAVSAKADKDQQQACWEFLKMFMSDGFQNELENYWPTKLSSLDKKKKDEQKPDIYIDENGKEAEYENTIMINGKEQKIGKVTDEECEKVMEFLKSLDQVMRYDQTIYEIINEETGAYFAGQKSAQETAEIIQNRVQTYLSEIQQRKTSLTIQ